MGTAPSAGFLGFEVVVLVVSFAFVSPKSQQEPKYRTRKENSCAGKGSGTKRAAVPLGEVSGPDSGCGRRHGYGLHRAPLRPSLLQDTSLEPCGMTPSFWVSPPHLEPEEL